MATTQKRSAMDTALYPLDWLEERSGLVVAESSGNF